ncbi:MAG TPA: glycosyltransferase family 39 protein [candidate division Zixibacteria bacterium]|nr:glycosyltransferase family 39 protein [candidate division Zixibacteria bacterium]
MALRGAALALTAANYSTVDIWALFDDTKFFRDVAAWFGDQSPAREESLLLVGPGYGFILYAGSLLLGWSAWGHLIAQVFVSAVNCLLVRVLALELGLKEREATLAALISAVSLSAIAASVMLYTETWYLTLTLLALILFLRGIRTRHTGRCLAAAALFCAAALVRSVGQFVPLAIAGAFIFDALVQRQRIRLTVRPALFLTLAVALTLAWPLRNYVVHGVFTISETGTRAARLYWTASALTGNGDAAAIDSVRSIWDKQVEWRYHTPTPTLKQRHEFDVSVIRDTLAQRPGRMMSAYLMNVWTNMTEESRIQSILMPQFTAFWRQYSKRFASGLGPWLVGFTLLGALALWRRGRRESVVFLLALYLYYGLITGATFWQGSRIFLPGQIAWAPLVAVCLVSAVDFFRSADPRV